MSISKLSGHMRSIKLNFTPSVLTLGLKAKIFENSRLFWRELRTLPTFDHCVVSALGWSDPFKPKELLLGAIPIVPQIVAFLA